MHITTAEVALAGVVGSLAGFFLGFLGTWMAAGRTAMGQRYAALEPLLWAKRADAYIEILEVLNEWRSHRRRLFNGILGTVEVEGSDPVAHQKPRDWSRLDGLMGGFGARHIRDHFAAAQGADGDFLLLYNDLVGRESIIPQDRIALMNVSNSAEAATEECRSAINHALSLGDQIERARWQ